MEKRVFQKAGNVTYLGKLTLLSGIPPWKDEQEHKPT